MSLAAPPKSLLIKHPYFAWSECEVNAGMPAEGNYVYYIERHAGMLSNEKVKIEFPLQPQFCMDSEN